MERAVLRFLEGGKFLVTCLCVPRRHLPDWGIFFMVANCYMVNNNNNIIPNKSRIESFTSGYHCTRYNFIHLDSWARLSLARSTKFREFRTANCICDTIYRLKHIIIIIINIADGETWRILITYELYNNIIIVSVDRRDYFAIVIILLRTADTRNGVAYTRDGYV